MYFTGGRIGPKFVRSTTRQRDRVLSATRGAAHDVADETVRAGRADIARAPGRFGQRWQTGLNAPVTEGGGNIRVSVTHDISYFMVHQRGATIRAKNPSGYLWIPLGRFKRAREVPGIFRVTSRKGNELLVIKKGRGIQPLFVGRRSVTLRKRFHVLEIARQVARAMPTFYRRRLASSRA